jgi:hypothetical protein
MNPVARSISETSRLAETKDSPNAETASAVEATKYVYLIGAIFARRHHPSRAQ